MTTYDGDTEWTGHYGSWLQDRGLKRTTDRVEAFHAGYMAREEEITRLRAENAEMLAELLVTDDRDRTHSEECWKWRGHHACAIARVKRLEATLDARMPGEER